LRIAALLLVSVNFARVIVQMVRAREALGAHATLVRLLARVHAVMPRQLLFRSKCFVTDRTGERAARPGLARVLTVTVLAQMVKAGELFTAMIAKVFLLPCVKCHVGVEIDAARILFAAHTARKVFFRLVEYLVHAQLSSSDKPLITFVAEVRVVAQVALHMVIQHGL